MGWFSDFFANLFGGQKSRFSPEELDIDIADDSVTINSNRVNIPCHLSVLTKLFGKPRAVNGKEGKRNYAWDNLGLYCYTNGNNVVYCIAVLSRVGDISLKYQPKSTYAGKLTILGKPWEETMSKAPDEEGFFRMLELENLSVISEYADFEKGDSEGFEGAYSNAEIQLKDR